MNMENENDKWKQKDEVIQRINKTAQNRSFPCELTIELLDKPVLDQNNLLNFMYQLEGVNALKIIRVGSHQAQNPDPYDYPHTLTFIIFDLMVNRRILEEDYKILRCGDLILNLVTGKAKYKKEAIYNEETQQHTLLIFLMSNQNKRISLKEISNLLGFQWEEGMKNTTTKRRIYDLLRDIKKKLDIKEKDELITANNGYRLRCP